MTLVGVEWLNVPCSESERLQVTPASVASFATVAVKVCETPLGSDAPAGLMVTLMGGGGVDPPMLLLPPPPQLVRKSKVDNPQ